MSHAFKRSSKYRINCNIYPFLQLCSNIHVVNRSTSPGVTTIFLVKCYGRFIEKKSKEKNLIGRVKAPDFLEGVLLTEKL